MLPTDSSPVHRAVRDRRDGHHRGSDVTVVGTRGRRPHGLGGRSHRRSHPAVVGARTTRSIGGRDHLGAHRRRPPGAPHERPRIGHRHLGADAAVVWARAAGSVGRGDHRRTNATVVGTRSRWAHGLGRRSHRRPNLGDVAEQRGGASACHHFFLGDRPQLRFMSEYALSDTVDRDFGREVPAALRRLMFPTRLFFLAAISTSTSARTC